MSRPSHAPIAPLPGESGALPADAVALGVVVGAHGVRGDIKIKPFSAQPEALLNQRHWWLTAPESATHFDLFHGALRIRCKACRVAGGLLVASLEGVDQRDTAQALRGVTIWSPRSAFPSLPSDEYYWVDLIGLKVCNRQGVVLGVVSEMLETGAAPVMVVPSNEQAPHLIPFVAAYVDQVDLQSGCLTVDWQPDFNQ